MWDRALGREWRGKLGEVRGKAHSEVSSVKYLMNQRVMCCSELPKAWYTLYDFGLDQTEDDKCDTIVTISLAMAANRRSYVVL